MICVHVLCISKLRPIVFILKLHIPTTHNNMHAACLSPSNLPEASGSSDQTVAYIMTGYVVGVFIGLLIGTN